MKLISREENSQGDTTCLSRPSGLGQTRGEDATDKQTLSESLGPGPEQENISATLESPRRNNPRTCRDKSKIYKKRARAAKPSVISTLDPTSSEEGLSPFYIKAVAELSGRLWQPVEADLLDLASSCSNRYALTSGPRSSFVTPRILYQNRRENPQTTFSPSQIILSRALKDADPLRIEDAVKPVALKTLTIQIFPDKIAKAILKTWYAAKRVTRNRIIAEYKASRRYDQEFCRKEYVNNSSLEGTKFEWMLECPREVRAQVLRDIAAELKAHNTKQKKIKEAARKAKKRFRYRRCNFKFSTRGVRSEVITVLKRDWIRPGGQFSFLKEIPTKYSGKGKGRGPDIPVPEHTVRVQRLEGRYYLRIPVAVEKYRPGPRRVLCGLDPGVRTFLTLYDGERVVVMGDAGEERTKKLHKRLDKLQTVFSARSSAHHRRRHVKLKLWRLNRKLCNIIDALHWESAKFMCSGYETILLPKYQSSDMTRKRNRKDPRLINSSTTRIMQMLSPYKFKQRLLFKAYEYGSRVVLCDEHHTSRTCSRCGHLNKKSTSKTFRCEKCIYIIDRDANSSKNMPPRTLCYTA